MNLLTPLLKITKEKFSLVERNIDEQKTIYDSHVVVRGNFPIMSEISKITDHVGTRISKLMGNYGMPREYTPFGFSMSYDHGAGHRWNTSSFLLERRGGEPYDKGLYFSTAPLSTNDHLDLLHSLDRS
jgi:hypothetical protein